MNRYLNSLLITLAFAVVIGVLISTLVSNSVVKMNVKKERIVKINLVKPKPKEMPPKVEQKPTSEPKSVTVPQPTQKPVETTKQVEKPTPTQKPVETTKQAEKPKQEASESNNGDISGFIGGLKSTINANKKYPSEAIREQIQGTVNMIFDIDSDGSVSNIRVSGGDVLLRNAAKKSLLSSCPIRIPSGISGRFPLKDITTNIVFKLE